VQPALGLGTGVFERSGDPARIPLTGLDRGRWGRATATGYTPSRPSSVATFSAQGFAHGPLSSTGTTALDRGVIQLVTPIQVHHFDPPGGRVLQFARLTVRFVPLALVWLHHRRTRR